ncbi:autotransporter assembly complex protein TamA [Celerinatantimonas sp. YJH-8]|uniref:autotransporter assembly complex protein TamA n=1 Tax=Celerinatantimonas sp. YJH-8 TaxID=3228714 RepID=UPI0038C80F65
MRWFLLIGLMGVSGLTLSAESYHIQGGSSAEQENVRLFLEAQQFGAQVSQADIHRQSLKKTQQALQALGYFQSHNQIEVSGPADSRRIDVRLDPGPSVNIAHVDLDLKGEMTQDPRFKLLLQNHALIVGKPFHSGQYEALKSAMNQFALTQGYFDGKFLHSQVQISLAQHQAIIHIQYNSGVRYRMGQIVFADPDVPRSLLTGLAPFHSGDPYQADQIVEFSQALNQTGYFKSVMVTPMLAHRHDGLIDLEVAATRKPSDTFSVGLGYSTDLGLKGQLTWSHPWVNRFGHSFSAAVEGSSSEQTLETEYRIPVTNPVNDFVALQTSYKRELENDTDSRSHQLTLSRQWYIDPQWTPTLFYKTLYEDYRQGHQSDSTILFLPGFSLTRLRREGAKSDPVSGDLISVTAQTANKAWLSDVNLTKLVFQAKWLRSLGRHRLISRTSLGAIWVDDIDQVPASMRFFAGGDQSIRGYTYKSISPEDQEGQLVGGKYLATASVEYNYQFASKWRAAVFYDTGTAANDLHHRLYAGAGVGIRWLTLIGPVRIDFAKGLVDAPDSWRVHFSLGPDL